MEAWSDQPKWKQMLRPLVPAGVRPWLYYAYAVVPQKGVSLVARALGLKMARAPPWPASTPSTAGGRGRTIRKILMVAQRYGYGRKQDGDSYEYAHLFPALKEAAGQAEFFDSLGTDENLERGEINRRLEQKVADYRPDLVFIAPFRYELDRRLIRRISETSGALTLAWFFDDIWRFDTYSRGWGGAVHAIATQDEQAARTWARLGQPHAYLVPFGYDQTVFHPANAKMKYDVSFVGAASHPGRKEAVGYLQARGIRVQSFGSGWEKGIFADLSELPRIFSSSKINLNFSHVSAPWEGRRQVKGRVFEVTGCGGFLLTEYAPGIEELFEIGKEIEVFRTLGEMEQKVRYYLEHEEERAAIAKAGLARAKKDHTYARRFSDLIEKLEKDSRLA